MRDEELEKVKIGYLFKGIEDIQERIEAQTHRMLVAGDQDAMKQRKQLELIKEEMFQCNAELLTAIAEYQEKMKKIYNQLDL